MNEDLNLKALMNLLYERMIKDGRLSMSLCLWENRDKALEDELIIRYTENALPMLYIKSKGEYKPIGTETDLNFNKFLQNFMEVSSVRTKEEFDPSIWFKTFKDSANTEGYSDENITQAYKEIESKLNLMKPYIMQVDVDKESHLVIPYMSTKLVFYDLGKLMANERVRNLEEVFQLLMQYMQKVRSDNQSMITAVNKAVSEVQIDITNQNNRQDENIEILSKEMQSQSQSNNSLLDKVNQYINSTETRIRPLRFTMQGSATYAYPVVFKLSGGGMDMLNGTEFFNAPLYLTFEDGNRINVLQLGDSNTVGSPLIPTNIKEAYDFVQVCNSANTTPAIYDVKRIDGNTWVVMLKGGQTYTAYSKYIEFLNIDYSTDAKYGINAVANIPNTVINKLFTDPSVRNLNSYSFRYTPNIQAVQSVISQNKYKISVV